MRGEGEFRRLRVAGTCTCPTTGFELTLEPDNPGVVPQPEEVVLRLVTSEPVSGGDALTATPVAYETEVGEEALRVIIRRNGAESLVVPISEESGNGYSDPDDVRSGR